MPIASLGYKRNNDNQNMTSLPLAPSKLINQQLPMGIQISAPKVSQPQHADRTSQHLATLDLCFARALTDTEAENQGRTDRHI